MGQPHLRCDDELTPIALTHFPKGHAEFDAEVACFGHGDPGIGGRRRRCARQGWRPPVGRRDPYPPRTLAAVMADFNRRVQKESRRTPYPSDELRRLGRSSPPVPAR
ncbi:hypothetical protein [Streptomyces sp. SD15]